MKKSEQILGPLADRSPKPQSRFEKEYQRYLNAKGYFHTALPELQSKYPGKYVAVVNGTVEIGEDRKTVRSRVIQEHGRVSMYIAKVESKDVIKRPVKMPSRFLKK